MDKIEGVVLEVGEKEFKLNNGNTYRPSFGQKMPDKGTSVSFNVKEWKKDDKTVLYADFKKDSPFVGRKSFGKSPEESRQIRRMNVLQRVMESKYFRDKELLSRPGTLNTPLIADVKVAVDALEKLVIE